MEFVEKFIAFVDILGFCGFVADAERGAGRSLDDLLDLLSTFGSPAQREAFAKYGPTICASSRYHNRDLDFRLTQISDCAIISTELSPAGMINLVHHVWGTVIHFLERGTLCRGYITRGRIYHTDHQVIGTGYLHAYQREAQVGVFQRTADERGTPFVEIDETITAYVQDCDATVKEMFRRYVKEDRGLIALFPFQRIAHSFVISGFDELDVAREQRENNKVRRLIDDLKVLIMTYIDKNNPGAVRKAEHYLAALDAQRDVCDKTDEFLHRFSTPAQPQQ